MNGAWTQIGKYAGYLGVVVCVAAVAGRFYGSKEFLGFQAINVFIVGVAFLAFGTWAKLEATAKT